MNYQLISTVSMVLFLGIIFYARGRYRRCVCEKKLRKKIRTGTPIHVEYCKGSFEVLLKTTKGTLKLALFKTDPSLKRTTFEVLVPSQMFRRVNEGRVYDIYYDSKTGMIHFDSDGNEAEVSSNVLSEHIPHACLSIKSRILNVILEETGEHPMPLER
jgi:hypothetical protein